jgi:hypothetical protein
MVMVALVTPMTASAFFCRYPRRHLAGLADLGGAKWVRLDLTLLLSGPECLVELDQGLLSCRGVRARTLGVSFSAVARNWCPSRGGRIRSLSYARRGFERIADVVMEAEFESGDMCTIVGVSPDSKFGGPIFGNPLPSIAGHITCAAPLGIVGYQGEVQFVEKPFQ